MRRLLYSYFRSSAAYRVRIALNLKGLDYEVVPVHLVRGEQRAGDFLALNPAGAVPVFVEDGAAVTQSLAIIEYLEESYPTPPLLPAGALDRARNRAIALTLACDTHPLNTPLVLNFLRDAFALDEAQKMCWYRHWVERGLTVVERQLADDRRTGLCCHGDQPTLADCFLIPQVFNALRFDCRLEALPTVCRIHDYCMSLTPFQRAAPGAQPDAE